MKRSLSLCLVTVIFLVSCGSGDNTSATTTSDSSSNTQSNSATTATDLGNTTGSTSSSTTGNGSIKEAMDKMMQNMQSMQMTGDPDHDFAMMMKMHHQGAIDMSNIELSKGTNANLKQVAQETINESQKDINDLNTFLGSHQPSKKSDFGQKQMDKMKSMNMGMDMGSDVDKNFAMMMSMHHQAGIQMAKDYLKVATAEEAKKIANNTIKSNSEGLKKLKAYSTDTMNQSDMKGMDMKNKDMKDMNMKNMDMNGTKKETSGSKQ